MTMPLFTELEYTELEHFPSLDQAWARLPVVMNIGGIGVRWAGPLVRLGHDRWLGDLAEAAYGYLEGCGWRESLSGAGLPLDGEGRLRPSWAAAFGEAARCLASEGERAGPESDPERWAAWLAFELAGVHGLIEARADAQGWDR
jgi:hypothetical protein